MSKLTMQDVRDYLGIDVIDPSTERVLQSLLQASEGYLTGALGKSYPEEDERVKTLQRTIIADLYDNRELNDKVNGARRRLIDSMILQIKLQMRTETNSGGDLDDV